ncbi:MAG: radical SAM/Cys-rich domain protein [Candidatus Aminicenantes bacterium]|nr:radical SAM/Cys-rich domain protein [Candidatus Aminicenantes bacterium]NIM82338.1 radical SAM/Cys-rich domain protein [Candidatus Aminicenantes bacterium]NIN21721.1 radical SAM/Cys-rich domain protein [Candidatus Aminicenantes bacterium]NIN45530.1 radical SAM/Cys-rich domain protein [Candidatus Aminicenantes bacterium]NIN88361.1 radical SAM/Cys-rich domain protein [Candidatus Aminicenantes bacterium]
MVRSFDEKVIEMYPDVLDFGNLETLQVNVGNRCNQVCRHCHLNAGPRGDKMMGKGVMIKIIDFLKAHPHLTLDITGGSPELNKHFRFLVEGTAKIVSRVMVRTNFTVFFEEGMEGLPEFYREHGVVVIGSLPCYLRENVNKQRGEGVYDKSIKALKRLNELGYGDTLELDLVYNPVGVHLPPQQKELEQDYKKYVMENYGIRFNNLFTIVNAPLGRFKTMLDSSGEYEKYMRLLEDSYNPRAALNIMCRNLVSVDYRGVLYNCDFNQVVDLPIRDEHARVMTIDDLEELIGEGFRIETGHHCYCCTAGSGSSCTGAIA